MISTADFIAALDQAVRSKRGDEQPLGVERVLGDAFRKGLDLPQKFFQTQDGHYARRLLHHAKDGSFSVVVMVWDVDQQTPLHDHDGRWCVECVLRGKLRVSSYEHMGKDQNNHDLFEKRTEVLAGEGETGHLIPPFEYHMIQNALPKQSSVTVHVYEKELVESTVFVPSGQGLGYLRERHTMSYADS